MNTFTPKANCVACLNEREWDKLTNMILEKCVVPIIGIELFIIERENGVRENLYDIWGKRLAEQNGIQLPTGRDIPLLYQVANQIFQECDLAYEVDDIIRRQQEQWPIPQALRKLAEMDSFSLYITTTIDHLLIKVLDEVRPDPCGRARQIIFSPRGDKTHIDLPKEFTTMQTPHIFHLFGVSCPVEGGFAKTEDDLIEFSWALLDQQYSPERLYDFLMDKTILMLGCHFPDWLGRFIIYALKGHHKTSSTKIYYVSSLLEQGLTDFLIRNDKRTTIISIKDATQFVDELHRRWSVSKPCSSCSITSEKADYVTTIKKGAVFISYAKEDYETAVSIKAQFDNANIDTWMDESGLEPGDEFQPVIRDNIRNASFFIAIISKNLDQPEKIGRFIWKEWKWAEDVNLERRKDDRFLQPLVIDDTPSGASFVERPMRDIHWSRLNNGLIREDLIHTLSQGIRRYRREK